jgi:hypothetical protein
MKTALSMTKTYLKNNIGDGSLSPVGVWSYTLPSPFYQ